MKRVTREEAQALFTEIGHEANITVPVTKPHGEVEYLPILNNAMVYNPYGKHIKQVGMSNNKQNAVAAMKFVKGQFKIYSSYFSYANGEYEIIAS